MANPAAAVSDVFPPLPKGAGTDNGHRMEIDLLVNSLTNCFQSQAQLAVCCLKSPLWPAAFQLAANDATKTLSMAIEDFTHQLCKAAAACNGAQQRNNGRLAVPMERYASSQELTLGSSQPLSKALAFSLQAEDNHRLPPAPSGDSGIVLAVSPTEDLAARSMAKEVSASNTSCTRGSTQMDESASERSHPVKGENRLAQKQRGSDASDHLYVFDEGNSSTYESVGSVKRSMTLSDLYQASPDMDCGLDDEDEDEASGKCINGVLNPQWGVRLGWDLFVILLVLIDAMFLPLQMAFETPDSANDIWLVITTTMFALDMIVSFNTAYEAGIHEPGVLVGKLVSKRRRIALNYMKTWFPIDFVSTIPFSSAVQASTGGEGGESAQVVKLTKILKLARFLRLMRMLRLAKLAVIWERIESRMGSLLLVQIIALARILFVLGAICHWNACVWWLIGQDKIPFIHDLLSKETQLDWESMNHWTTFPRSCTLPGPIICTDTWSWANRTKSDSYFFSFYWTLGVMRTMPAEVQPTNLVERVYIMIFMFFAFSVFAITITLITQTYFKMQERRKGFNDDMAAVRTHLRAIHINEPVQLKIKAFLRHLYDRRRIHAKELAMYKQLPKTLCEHMLLGRTSTHIQKISILKGLPDRNLLQVIQITEQLDLAQGEVLCRRNRSAEAAWLLIDGKLSVSYSRNSGQGDPVLNLQVVDEECLLSTAAVDSEYTVFACICSEVLRLDKRKFFQLLEKNKHLEQYLKHNFDLKNRDAVSGRKGRTSTSSMPGKNCKTNSLTHEIAEVDTTAAIVSS